MLLIAFGKSISSPSPTNQSSFPYDFKHFSITKCLVTYYTRFDMYGFISGLISVLNVCILSEKYP